MWEQPGLMYVGESEVDPGPHMGHGFGVATNLRWPGLPSEE